MYMQMSSDFLHRHLRRFRQIKFWAYIVDLAKKNQSGRPPPPRVRACVRWLDKKRELSKHTAATMTRARLTKQNTRQVYSGLI